MIQTSYFRARGLPLDRCVAISLTVPRGYTGRRYPALAPSRELLRAWREDDLTWVGYTEWYQLTVLDNLRAMQVAADLDGKIVVCWEWDRLHCHRRLVAEWLEAATGEQVPEWEAGRESS
ncbi:MAG: DUF488 family protein [Pseudomonadota bacterium]